MKTKFKITNIKIFITVVTCIIALLLSINFLSNSLVTPVINDLTNSKPIYAIDTNEKKIALTFDAAWGDQYTQEILNILAQYDIKCTFFVVGFWIEKYPEQVKAIELAGHEIGNHSNSHKHMTKLSNEQIMIDLDIAWNKINTLAPQAAVKLFRFPFGDYDGRTTNILQEIGYMPIQWDVDSLDWKNYGSEDIINRVVSKAKTGSIVLFHNNADYTTKALPVIIEKLLNKGYELVKVSDIILDEPWTIDHMGKQKQTIIKENTQ